MAGAQGGRGLWREGAVEGSMQAVKGGNGRHMEDAQQRSDWIRVTL